MNDFASLDTPGGPVGVKVVEWNQNQLIWSLCSAIGGVPNEQRYRYAFLHGNSFIIFFELHRPVSNSSPCLNFSMASKSLEFWTWRSTWICWSCRCRSRSRCNVTSRTFFQKKVTRYQRLSISFWFTLIRDVRSDCSALLKLCGTMPYLHPFILANPLLIWIHYLW